VLGVRPRSGSAAAARDKLVRHFAVCEARAQGRHGWAGTHRCCSPPLLRGHRAAALGHRAARTLKLEVANIASKQHAHPRRGLIAVGAGTIEEWLLRYRRDGLDGLEDKRRRDLGKSRRIDAELADAIVEIAEGRPELDGAGLLSELAAMLEGIAMPSLSTLSRFLRSRGLDQRRAPGRKDHRAFAFDLAGDCWQGGVMYGPSLPTKDLGERSRKPASRERLKAASCERVDGR
jgi:transposase